MTMKSTCAKFRSEFGLRISFGFRELGIRISLLQPASQAAETFVRARDDLHADNLSYLSRRCGACVSGCLHRRDVAAEKASDIAAADFFPAGKRDIGRLECGVTRFEQSAEAFAFDHSDCLLSHMSDSLNVES